MDSTNLALGMVFRPTDEECVFKYLRKKVSGTYDKGFLYIRDDIDIYKCQPSELPSLAPKTGEGIMYFFSPLHKKWKNAERKAPGGYWKKAGNIKKFHENGKLIATKTPLSYYKKDETSTSNNGEWLMKEYVLESGQLPEPQDQAAGTSKKNPMEQQQQKQK